MRRTIKDVELSLRISDARRSELRRQMAQLNKQIRELRAALNKETEEQARLKSELTSLGSKAEEGEETC